MVTALKRFTIDRAPRVLTLCLKRFDFYGKKIGKVCTQLEGNSLSLPGAGDFPKQDALSQAVQVELFVFPSGERRAPVARQAHALLRQSCSGREQFPATQGVTCCFRDKKC